MKNNFLLEIVTPEKLVFSKQVKEVVVPTVNGDITILAKHAPLISMIIPGKIIITTIDNHDIYITYGGFAQITNNVATLLLDSVTHLDALDDASLESRIEAAQHASQNADTMHERNKHEDLFYQLSSLRHSL